METLQTMSVDRKRFSHCHLNFIEILAVEYHRSLVAGNTGMELVTNVDALFEIGIAAVDLHVVTSSMMR